MNEAIADRMNPWLFAAFVAAIVLLAAAVLIASQPGLAQAIGGMLHGVSHAADICSGSQGPC
jgi:hypothetical protein